MAVAAEGGQAVTQAGWLMAGVAWPVADAEVGLAVIQAGQSMAEVA